MLISVNGLSVEDFSPQPYVNVWLRDRRSTVSAPRGKGGKETDEEKDELRKKSSVDLLKTIDFYNFLEVNIKSMCFIFFLKIFSIPHPYQS